jgi:hypothetical protein
MFKTITRFFKKLFNKHLGTNFQHTVLGLEMIYSNLDFVETDQVMVIDGKVMIRINNKCVKNNDGVFVIPDEIATSGLSYFVKFDGSIFLERK